MVTRKKLSLVVILLLLATNVTNTAQAQQPIQFNTPDHYTIKGRLWKQSSAAPAIILLHQCDSDQQMYGKLAQLLYEKGFHVLTFDYRGIGESASDQYNIKTTTDKSGFWKTFMEMSRADMHAALDYFNSAVQQQNLSILGASCGGDKAITLATDEDANVAALGFLSSRLSQQSLMALNKISNTPTLFIAARSDNSAFSAAQKGSEVSKNLLSKSYYYDGNDHGYPLFKKDKELEEHIAAWFQRVVDER